MIIKKYNILNKNIILHDDYRKSIEKFYINYTTIIKRFYEIFNNYVMNNILTINIWLLILNFFKLGKKWSLCKFFKNKKELLKFLINYK